MRKAQRPTHIKPELVFPGDMIEIRYESAGVNYSETSYVGRINTSGAERTIIAANDHTALLRYTPGKGVSYPHRDAQVFRHRTAPSSLDTLFHADS